MRKPTPLPATFAQRPFTLKEAQAAHITTGRARSSDLVTPSRGIRIPSGSLANGPPAQDPLVRLLDRCRPYTEVTNSSVVSHITAAKIHGLYLPQWCENVQALDLSRPRGMPEPRRRRVSGHRMALEQTDIDVIGGVPVTSVPRTLLDLSPLLTLDQLVAIADQIVCEHKHPFGQQKFAMVKLDALNAYIAAHQGLHGLRRLRAAMKLARVGVDSPPETRLRLIIVRSDLPVFEPGIELSDSAGRPLVSPDLACEEYKTCIEYDGRHHFTPEQQGKDHDRDFITKSLGWHQVVINKEDVFGGDRVVVTKVARMLLLGGWADPNNLAGRSLRGRLGVRKDFE